MKKLLLPLLTLFIANNTVTAQTSDFNKWSIDLNGGLTKPARGLSKGYYADTFNSLYHVDLGARYMFNNKFGIKADFGYDSMKEGKNSLKFETSYYRFNLQGVANLGRIMNFEEWTSVLNLQAHAGVGYSWMTSDNFTGKDNMGNVITGLTGQVKLGNRVALNLDFSMINNIRQNKTFDGTSDIHKRAFQGTLFNSTVGFSFYLGDKNQHADWYVGDKFTNRLDEIENKISTIENNLLDSDNDGVADYLDLEPNTPEGNMVSIKGVSIDLNKNGIPDSYEAYFAEYYQKDTTSKISQNDIETAKGLINDGYISMYFDFNKSQPKNVDAAHFVLTYLKSNPNATVEINGYADSVGSSSYNKTLSESRAKSVAKILEEAGISSSRIKYSGKGIDSSLNGENKAAASFARRVTFKVN